MTIETCKGLQK